MDLELLEHFTNIRFFSWLGAPVSAGGVFLGLFFPDEAKIEREIDRQMDAASAVMPSLCRSVFGEERDLSRNAKLSIYHSIRVPTPSYGHELWLMTERFRLQILVAKIALGGWVHPHMHSQEFLSTEEF